MSNETNDVNLHNLVEQAMLNEGFVIDLPRAVIDEANLAAQNDLTNSHTKNVVDLRNLFWSSIDNNDSRDLDQVEVAEQLADDSIRLRVGIADVDAFVPQKSATDLYALENTTSVYTGIQTFPMLPRPFSEAATSLLENAERLAIVIDFTVARDGSVKLNDIYQALVINRAQLDYDEVGAWLEDSKAPLKTNVSQLEILQTQLHLQDAAADRLQMVRARAGALEFGTVEATTAKRNGEIYDVVVQQKNQARYLIENLMITSNVLIAEFLASKNYPKLERIVRRPERWQRIVELAAGLGEELPSEPNSQALSKFLERRRHADPLHFPDLSLSIVKLIGAGDYTVIAPGSTGEGHFGLAVNGYTHSTAPNRRYADLITQRLVKAAIKLAPPPYSLQELEEIADRCNERQSAERKVERLTRKIVAAEILKRRIGETFQGVVTGASSKGVFVRLINPPAEGKIVRGAVGADVGDRVTVRLINTNLEKGFIDFEKL